MSALPLTLSKSFPLYPDAGRNAPDVAHFVAHQFKIALGVTWDLLRTRLGLRVGREPPHDFSWPISLNAVELGMPSSFAIARPVIPRALNRATSPLCALTVCGRPSLTPRFLAAIKP